MSAAAEKNTYQYKRHNEFGFTHVILIMHSGEAWKCLNTLSLFLGSVSRNSLDSEVDGDSLHCRTSVDIWCSCWEGRRPDDDKVLTAPGLVVTHRVSVKVVYLDEGPPHWG